MKKFLLSILLVCLLMQAKSQCNATQVNFNGTCFLLLSNFPPNVSVLIYSQVGVVFTPITTVVVNASGSSSITLASCLPPFIYASGGGCTTVINGVQNLPLKFSNVSLVKDNTSNQFNFAVGNETTGSEYILEKSYDGITFINTLSKYVATSNNLQVNMKRTLTDIDNTPVIFYRVKAKELVGTYSYSTILKVNNKLVQPSVFPNPAKNVVQLSVTNEYKNGNYVILDLQGKTLLSGVISFNSQQLDVSILPKGLYILKVMSKTDFVSIKLIKD
jgi:Secretion system C-terminal sorting domain